jgi:hypothetical protein
MTVENGTPRVAATFRQLLPSERSWTAWSRLNTRRGLPKAFAAPLCGTNARHNALPDEFPLEFRECGEDVQQEPGGEVTLVGIDVLRDRDERLLAQKSA